MWPPYNAFQPTPLPVGARLPSLLTMPAFDFRTLPALWRRYEEIPRRLAYPGGASHEIAAWQMTLRSELARLLGLTPAPASATHVPRDAQVIETAALDAYTRELVVLPIAPGEHMPCHVLIPRDIAPPHRPVIALHGHGTWAARPLIGQASSPGEAAFIRLLNYDYAHQLALRGFMVFVPVLRGFGERMEDPPLREVHDPADPEAWVSSCKYEAVNALMLGKTLLGLRVADILRLIDYIRARPEPMAETLGCAGLSGGGTITLFAAALDERITCAVISGYLNTFRDSIMAMDHCLCNFVPGIVNYAEMPDIAGLIAPRPLLIESGLRDPIYPIAGARKAFAYLQRIYGDLGASERLDADFFEGEHRWSGAKAYDWLGAWL